MSTLYVPLGRPIELKEAEIARLAFEYRNYQFLHGTSDPKLSMLERAADALGLCVAELLSEVPAEAERVK